MSQEHTSQEQSAADIPAFLASKDNKPFANEASVSRAIRQRGLDEALYTIKPHQDGFVAVLKSFDTTALPAPAAVVSAVPPPPAAAIDINKYYRVKFQQKSDANQPDEVILSVNGEVLQITRNVEVIIPYRFKEAADNGVTPQFKQLPGQTRKQIGEVRTFPYDLLGEATEQEFLRLKEEGTRLTRQSVESAAL
jgi:hypothetical protein